MGTGNTAWLWYSILATSVIVPVFISIPYFAKNYHVKPEVFLAWYFIGSPIGVSLWLSLNGRTADLLPEGGEAAVLAILLIGATFGAGANSSLFKAVVLAPNTGFPPAIYSAASVIVYLASAGLASRLPRYFNPVNTDPDRFLGVLLVVAGLFLTAGGWQYLRTLLRG